MNQETGIAVVVIWLGLLYITNKVHSKKDGRFKLGLKPKSKSLKGWLYSILISIIFLPLFILCYKKG